MGKIKIFFPRPIASGNMKGECLEMAKYFKNRASLTEKQNRFSSSESGFVVNRNPEGVSGLVVSVLTFTDDVLEAEDILIFLENKPLWLFSVWTT